MNSLWHKSKLIRPLLAILLLASCLTAKFSFADIDNLRLLRLSPNEGLSQGSITSLLLDNNGFLWIGTDGGLNFYDGYEVKLIKGPDDIFADSAISYLFQDSKGLIWISTLYSGLYSLQPETLRIRKVLDTASKTDPNDVKEVIHLVEAPNSDLWLAVSDELILYHRETGQTESLFNLKEVTSEASIIRRLLIRDDVVYIATSVGLYVMDSSSKQWKVLPYLDLEKPNIDQINAKELYLDNQQTLWVGTVEGLYSLPVNSIKQYIADEIPAPSSHIWEPFRNIWRLLPNENGFYVATDDGLYLLKQESGEFNRLWRYNQSRYQISENNIPDMLQDNQGNLWLASRGSGAFYWAPKTARFHNIHQGSPTSNPLSHDTVWSLLQASDENLWIATENGLNRLNLKTNQLTNFLVNPDKKAIGTTSNIDMLIPNDPSTLWLSTADGLLLFDTKLEKTIPLPLKNEKENKLLAAIGWGYHKDNQNRLWLINEKGFLRYDPESAKLDPLDWLNNNLSSEFANAFLGSLPGRPNTMLIGTAGQLWLYNESENNLEKIYQVTPNQPQTFITPDNWLVDNDNTLWLSISGHGLIGLDMNNFSVKFRYDVNNGLPSNIVYALQMDKQGDIWFSTHSGLIVMRAKSHHFEQFSFDDGLAANEFNGGAKAKLKDGRLVYGSMKGLTIFKPEALKTVAKNNIDINITGVSLMSRELPPYVTNIDQKSIVLNHNDVGLKINFSSLNFEKQNNTIYRIKLIGNETIDYPKTKENSMTFAQLDSGEYVFLVSAINPQNGLESSPAELFLTVKYPPFQSPLAYATYGLLVLSIFLYWLHSRRLRQILLKKAHKEVLASEERLQLALRGSGSGEWDWLADSNQLFENRINDELGYDYPKNTFSLSQRIELIHTNDKNEFLANWENFVSKPETSFEFTYRLKTNDDEWLWYHDLGRVVAISDDGKPLRVAGTYSNITESRANQEKAKLFGEAFKQTRDWVVILDNRFRPIAANQSFYDAFEVSERELFSSFVYTLGIDKNKLRFYTHLLSTLSPNAHWQGEELVVTKQGLEYPSLIKVSAISDNAIDIENFVVVITDISEQKKAEGKLRALANYDGLTGLPNRMLLLERMHHAFNIANRSGKNLAVFFIDLDRFKHINDSLGHDAGDIVLQEVATRLKNVLREDDTVARFGGDEFIVLLESYSNPDDISHIAQKVITAVDQPIQLNNNQLRVSPSIGIALYPNDAKNSNDLLKFADVAMYHAKEIGGRDFYFFDESMNQTAKNRLSLENKMRQALIDNEFSNFYQPIIKTGANDIAGFELLLRWSTADGMISPADFVPIAEEIGLIIPMTINLLEQGLKDLKQWQQSNPSIYLSVNLSARHIEQPSLIEEVKNLLQTSQVPASSLRFEITEGSLMRDHKKSTEIMRALNDIGIEFSLDDFGTGYSSLQYLKRLPISVIKIDRSFIKDIGLDSNNEAIIDTILLMAKSLNKCCVAEGVESKQQLDYLTDRGCDFIQGFLFSKPMPANATLDFIDHYTPTFK